MLGNTFGNIFKVTTFGESHGQALGGIIEGCPAGLQLDIKNIQYELNRRRPGQSDIVSKRNEFDKVEFVSGLLEGFTIGTPIGYYLYNFDKKTSDYNNIKNIYRPSHADFTYYKKYGIRDYRGGGRSSARETTARIVGGAIAKQLLKKIKKNIKIYAFVSSIGELVLEKSYKELNIYNIEKTPVRCPDIEMSKKMISLIKEVQKSGDTIGGIITCVIEGVPIGLGEPVFNKLHAEIGKAILSINAVKGFDYGSGFDSTHMRGSVHNDSYNTDYSTITNYSGGIQGGISNGMDIYFRVAFKPVSTLMQSQKTVDSLGREVFIKCKGRHDSCVVPRAIPIVEAMTALVIADYFLLNRISKLDNLCK